MKPQFKIRNYTGSDGLNQIQLYYSHKGKVLMLDTGVKTKVDKNGKPLYFNGKQISSKQDGYERDNDILDIVMNKVEGIIIEHKKKFTLEPTVDWVKEKYYEEGLKQGKEVDIIPLFESWIIKKGKKIKNIKLYTTILGDLKAMYPGGKLYFRNINNKFLDKLLDHWLNIPIQNSTINKRLSCLKHFFQKMYDEGVNEYYYFKGFKSDLPDLNTNVNIVILTPDEFDKYLNYTFQRKALGYVRDLYCVSCSMGLRFSDVIRLAPENFYVDKFGDDWCVADIAKTEELQLRIPLTPIAKEILTKYNFKFRSISNQKCNDYLEDGLKEVFEKYEISYKVPIFSKSGTEVKKEMVEKYTAVDFHSSRKFFITTCVNSGIPIGDVAAWSGHNSTTISKYITKGTNKQNEVRGLFTRKITKEPI